MHLAENLLGVGLQLGTQLHVGQVGLQQQVGLDMRVVELGVGQFVRDLLCQLPLRKRGQARLSPWEGWGYACPPQPLPSPPVPS